METKTLFTTIRRLFNKWEKAGYPPEEIEDAEKKFGALPGLLKAYYLELGADEQINRTQNRIESPDRLTIEDGHLVFYGENQNCYYWGIPVDQLTQYDPPVCILFPEYSGIKSDRTIQKEHLSDFLDAAAYFNAASWGLEYASELLWVSPQSIDYIRTNYKSKQNDLPRAIVNKAYSL